MVSFGGITPKRVICEYGDTKDKDGKIIAEVFIAPSDTNLSPGRCDDCKDPIRRGALSLTGSGSSTAGMNPGRRISIYHKGVCINCPIE